ncbi:hypothetical protein GDO86_001603 [Hymenochirus boettgeri]|uniref:Ig-like domain-containing protein n=1 Tax=Hymenochirus boettgeri TaxID=247094 RepID=A0A8T2KLP7_9PIPI|nr:hypothetical protein GDO86_001603 [Hymenochirus boettgeri]
MKKPGDTVKLTCKTSGYDFGSYAMHWVQQMPEKGLQWVGRIHTDTGETAYSPSCKERFKITKDNSIGTSFLEIISLKLEDTAIYYCARHNRKSKEKSIQKHLHP